jgi:SAM-dependent methyltransferase
VREDRGVDLATFERLQGPAGQQLLARAQALHEEGTPPLRAGDLLRREARDLGEAPDLAAAALTQADLRARGVAKLGPEGRTLYLTSDGLQQATRPEIAARRATRLLGAVGDGAPVLDLCCGVGVDLAALARAGTEVTGVDQDPVTAALARANLEVLSLPGRVLLSEATTVPRSPYAAVFLDPARRGARGRTFDVDAYSPPWSFVEEVLDGPGPACVKVAPGVPHERVPPATEAEWVSVGGEVKEAALWSGPLVSARRRATLLRGDTAATVTDADDPGPEAIGTGPVGAYLVEPDGAVIRAGLVTAVAARVAGRLLDEHIAYLTTDVEPRTPLGRGYRVLEELPYQEKRLRAALRERGIGRLTIKKRGVQVVPETLRRRLALRGASEATLVLTRVAGHGTALLVEPVGPA